MLGLSERDNTMKRNSPPPSATPAGASSPDNNLQNVDSLCHCCRLASRTECRRNAEDTGAFHTHNQPQAAWTRVRFPFMRSNHCYSLLNQPGYHCGRNNELKSNTQQSCQVQPMNSKIVANKEWKNGRWSLVEVLQRTPQGCGSL